MSEEEKKKKSPCFDCKRLLDLEKDSYWPFGNYVLCYPDFVTRFLDKHGGDGRPVAK